MKSRAASLVELHAFLGVCKAGTMRQVAEQLCVTQAAVSRAVLRLERRLGCPLFERSAQGVVPNAQAQALLARIEPSLLELERAFQPCLVERELASGELVRPFAAAGAGALLMYTMDPQQGRRRAALLRDRWTRLASDGRGAFEVAASNKSFGHLFGVSDEPESASRTKAAGR